MQALWVLKILKNNEHFTQIKRPAMGTKFAPSYATLVLGLLKEKLYNETEKHISKDFSNYLQKTWKRY